MRTGSSIPFRLNSAVIGEGKKGRNTRLWECIAMRNTELALRGEKFGIIGRSFSFSLKESCVIK